MIWGCEVTDSNMLLNMGVAIILWCAWTTYAKQRILSLIRKKDDRRWRMQETMAILVSSLSEHYDLVKPKKF